jgi:hypothetical protein
MPSRPCPCDEKEKNNKIKNRFLFWNKKIDELFFFFFSLFPITLGASASHPPFYGLAVALSHLSFPMGGTGEGMAYPHSSLPVL